jgi:hypothetical protein
MMSVREGPVPTYRERASDALLRNGIELAADRELMTRRIEAGPHNTRGYEQAASAMMMAQWYDSMLLWLSRRLRPKPRPGR